MKARIARKWYLDDNYVIPNDLDQLHSMIFEGINFVTPYCSNKHPEKYLEDLGYTLAIMIPGLEQDEVTLNRVLATVIRAIAKCIDTKHDATDIGINLDNHNYGKLYVNLVRKCTYIETFLDLIKEGEKPSIELVDECRKFLTARYGKNFRDEIKEALAAGGLDTEEAFNAFYVHFCRAVDEAILTPLPKASIDIVNEENGKAVHFEIDTDVDDEEVNED